MIGILRAVVSGSAIADPEQAIEVESTVTAIEHEIRSPHPKLAVLSTAMRSLYASLTRAVVTPPGIVAVNMASTAIYNLTVHGHV